MAKSPSPRKSKGKDTPQEAATESVTKQQVATKKEDSMSDVSSILEFSEDVSSQEAPVPLPEGDYTFEIRSAVRKTGSTSGKDYAELMCYIGADQYPADYTDGDPDGVVLPYRKVSLEDTPSARYRLRKVAEAIGAPAIKTRLDLNEWVGLTGTGTIRHEEYEGEKRANITRIVQP